MARRAQGSQGYEKELWYQAAHAAHGNAVKGSGSSHKGVKKDAPAVRERGAAYQQHVSDRWTHAMFGGDEQDEEQKESA